ncbi:MAG: methyltransferase domain-containing protein, partial [Bacteroidales bacterium]
AYMAQNLELQPDDRVLEVGSGCGYSAAILSRLVKHVYTIEIIEWLTQVGRKNLQKAGIKNVSLRHGDGYQGWPEEAPFDKILLTAAAAQIPDPLKDQVKKGGSILAPVADHIQKLILLKKNQEDIFTEHHLIYVSFVPMTGQAPPKPMK